MGNKKAFIVLGNSGTRNNKGQTLYAKILLIFPE
jgi:hypothetical protein